MGMNLTQAFGSFDDDLPDQRELADSVLKGLLNSASVLPHSEMKQRILGRLGFEGDSLLLSDLPPTTKYSNHLSWLRALSSLLPAPGSVDSIFMKEVRHDEKIVQTLVVSKVNVPKEIHDEFSESFFILDGKCLCTIGGKEFQLSAGDYLDIPLHVPHDVRLLSPQVTAIIQYRL
jgi:mannose-6-phosphate isomerase-like protein (cupin superfamily)